MALVILAPVMLAVAIGIVLTMGRPIFFSQERAGFRGRPFTSGSSAPCRSPTFTAVRNLTLVGACKPLPASRSADSLSSSGGRASRSFLSYWPFSVVR